MKENRRAQKLSPFQWAHVQWNMSRWTCQRSAQSAPVGGLRPKGTKGDVKTMVRCPKVARLWPLCREMVGTNRFRRRRVKRTPIFRKCGKNVHGVASLRTARGWQGTGGCPEGEVCPVQSSIQFLRHLPTHYLLYTYLHFR